MPAEVQRDRFPEIAASLAKRVEPAVRATAEKIAAGAKARVPIESGDLQRAIHATHRDYESRVIAGDGDDVFYGHMVEGGTTHSAPQPFLIPALEAEVPSFQAAVTAALRSI